MTVVAGSQNARLLDVLADGAWHLSRELHERAGYMRTNSRVSELRSYGHLICGESVPGKTGTDGYRYRLVTALEEPAVEATAAVVPASGRLLERVPKVPLAPPLADKAAAPPGHAGLQLSLLDAAA